MKPHVPASHALNDFKSRLCAFGAFLCLMGFVGCANASTPSHGAVAPLAFWSLAILGVLLGLSLIHI